MVLYTPYVLYDYTAVLSSPYYAALPVLNLLASAPIDANHQGTLSDPYVILE